MVASWACEVTEILTQRSTEEASLCEVYRDLTSPPSNNMPDIQPTVCFVYDTLKIFFRAFMFLLFNPSF